MENLFHGFYACANGPDSINLMGDVLTGRWIESHGFLQNKNVYYLQNKKYENATIKEMLSASDAFFAVIRATFGVYAGASAENGKIFTGDKLQWQDAYGAHTGIVQQEGNMFYVFTEAGKTALDIVLEEAKSRGGIQILEQVYGSVKGWQQSKLQEP